MSILILEIDEIQKIINIINDLQILYHPIYSPNGSISIQNFFKMKTKNPVIILDSNLVSPLYELVKNGKSNNESGSKSIALLLLFANCIDAQLSSGLALIENEMNGKSSFSSSEKNEYFLHGINTIPSIIWKKYILGEIDEIPSQFLKPINIFETNTFKIFDNPHFKMHKIALLRIVYLLRNSNMNAFDKFIDFMTWYTEHLLLTESLMVYAAMTFAKIEHVKPPKNCFSSAYDKVLDGIDNQAWDIHHLSQWSVFYHNELNNKVFFFATNDITLKHIIINSIPPGEGNNAIMAIFNTKKQKEALITFYQTKLGDHRVKPFELSNIHLNDIFRQIIRNRAKQFKIFILIKSNEKMSSNSSLLFFILHLLVQVFADNAHLKHYSS